MSDEEDVERDEDSGEEGEETGVYHLDLDDEEGSSVDDLTREALEAVDRVERSAEKERAAAAEREAMIEQLEAEIADLRDRSMRTLADFENFRKRAERDREELRRHTVADLLRTLLPVVDNLERALEAGGSVEDLKTGVDMILRQFRDLLAQQGVQEVHAQGERFDPSLHDAVARQEGEVTEPTVLEELQRGYTLHGRLLRPAMVRVAVPAGGDDDG